jgi:hypothetical protein
MKKSGLSRSKRAIIALFLMLFLYVSVINDLPTVSADGAVLVVEPSLVTANPSASFYLYVSINNVTDLYTFAFSLYWQANLLKCTGAIEIRTFFDGDFGPTVYTDHVDLGSSLVGSVPGVTGSGRVVRFTFQVLSSGNCTLELRNSSLLNSSGQTIAHTVVNGYFYTDYPVAQFTYSPDPLQDLYNEGRPIVGEVVTFNATTSYDPDEPYDSTPGGIVSYFWDFGEGTNGSGAVVTHVYNVAGTYQVVLNVTDDEGLTDIFTYPVEGLRIHYHEISVINATIARDSAAVYVGNKVYINVTVLNEGLETEYMNVTAYVQWYPANPENVWHPVNTTLFVYYVIVGFGAREPRYSLDAGKNATGEVIWDTTGFYPGNYTVRVEVSLVKRIGIVWESFSNLEPDKTDNQQIVGEVSVNPATTTIYNVAVTSAGIAPADLKIDEWTSAEVTIKNKGTVNVNFNATITVLYPNGTLIQAPWQFANLTFVGTTKTLSVELFKGSNTTMEGSYNLTVTVRIVNATTLEEIPDVDVSDNTISTPCAIRMKPVAYFKYSPIEIQIGMEVTFNASKSYGPGLNGGNLNITRYAWDFGDGSSFEGNKAVIVHKYDRAASYVVELKVTDDAELTAEYSSSAFLVRAFHQIAVTAVKFSPSKIAVGGSVEINVTVKNMGYFQETVNVTAYYNTNKIAQKTGTILDIGSEATLVFNWLTQDVAAGDYVIKAWASNVPGETETADNTLIAGTVTVDKLASTITASASPTSIKLGETLTINGTVTPKKAGLTVRILSAQAGEEWSLIQEVATNANGEYSYTWTPDGSGVYAVKSTWTGNEFASTAESDPAIVEVTEVSTAPDIFLFSSIGLAIALIAALVYFIVIRKPKPT